MRTENPSTPAARIRAYWSRARRSVLEQGPAVRWLAGLGVLAAILAFGYMATAPASGKYLGGGRPYSSGDREKIARALDAEGIPYRVVDQCIDVAAARFEEASAIVSKLDLGPHSPAEIRRRTQASGLWKSFETTSEKEQRDLQVREEILEALIAKFNGIESVFVRLNRIRTYQGLRPVSTTSASVDLETEDNRDLHPDVVQAIQNVILANEPEVKSDAVTVIDRRGRLYLKAGNPTVGAISRTKAREDEIRRQVSDELSWIKGLQVSVRLVPAPPPPKPAPVPEPPPAAHDVTGVNTPVGSVEPEPKPAPVVPKEPTPPPAPAPERHLAKVWVKVPSSFYHKAATSRSLSSEEISKLMAKTQGIIRQAVALAVAPAEAGEEPKIDIIPDDVETRSAPVPPAIPETLRSPSWWLPAGVAGGASAMALIVGLRMLAVRRPSPAPPASEKDLGRFTRDEPSESVPAPTERVRELIRRNPDAAASVLNRWIGQGGHAG